MVSVYDQPAPTLPPGPRYFFLKREVIVAELEAALSEPWDKDTLIDLVIFEGTKEYRGVAGWVQFKQEHGMEETDAE